eukprot:scaffold82785_cov30-Tisochrysis_lutea.AAC.9
MVPAKGLRSTRPICVYGQAGGAVNSAHLTIGFWASCGLMPCVRRAHTCTRRVPERRRSLSWNGKLTPTPSPVLRVTSAP